ncbi:multi-sensor signal transduction histidine kinase [Candidatus Koribacter versatilis Ellin345]|uniref:histidine kinase n=1 Tax=Koribacter versatilis (strain Ellin345) TaxID=204669 RepID=Q1ILH4_KORVE|nr:ATP-binding protein [Candidatus Koribacter versatilis]ABF42276.1 multi-sensor signal transduction histidine kinase [Candidatus Koribacter versatilis Ellin345]
MRRIRLKTKLVIAISAMVFALVATLSYLYVSQLVLQRIRSAYNNGDFVAREIRDAARDAVAVDLRNTDINPSDSAKIRAVIADSLQTDPGVNTLLQSIVGYSPTTYDAGIYDRDDRVLVHTDSSLLDKVVHSREDFAQVRDGSFFRQMNVVYGKPEVYDIHLPIQRDGKPFGDIRIGVSTVFLKSELRPQLNRALTLSIVCVLVSFLLAAVLSNLALRPLEAIGRRLDQMTVDTGEAQPTLDLRNDEYGAITKIDRLGREIRDVKEVFSALKENLDQIMGTLQDGLMLFTRDWRVVLVSASAERFVGVPRGEMLGKHVEEVFTDHTKMGRIVLDAYALHQSVPQREIEIEKGRRVQFALDFIEERGQRIGALITIRDAESVRRIENEIELSRRLAAIGRLTSGVAHEVKNPINAIVVHLEILKNKLQEVAPDARRHMDIIENEIRRLDRVVQTLVDFTRPVELKLFDADLRKIAEEVALLAGPEAANKNVHIEFNAVEKTLPVYVDTDLVKQAILNIVINGVQAMSDGGTLKITARSNDSAALLEISDQGPGIPKEIQDKIFNLYFTTKKTGTGIGLAMTYRVMQLHNGALEFETEPGKGTTFRLQVPLRQSQIDQIDNANTSARISANLG